MKDFIHTGFHKPTMTTCDDPSLKVIEVDNGNTWLISFYAKTTLIDTINMEHLTGTEIHESVKRLKVFDQEGIIIDTVEDRIKDALENYML